MQSIKHTLLSLVLGATSLSSLAGQNFWHNMSIVGGIALGEQDRRLFYYPSAERVLARNPKKLDYGLTLYVEKKVLKWHALQIHAGIGYAESNTLFGRPFAHSKLDGVFSEELRHIDRYTINKLILPVSNELHFGKFYLQINALPAISFRKSVLDKGDTGNNRFTKWQFALNSLEINPGLGFQFSDRIQMSISYRSIYLHEIDGIIFNTALLRDLNHEFLQQNIDKDNPFKMWLTVGYKLKK